MKSNCDCSSCDCEVAADMMTLGRCVFCHDPINSYNDYNIVNDNDLICCDCYKDLYL